LYSGVFTQDFAMPILFHLEQSFHSPLFPQHRPLLRLLAKSEKCRWFGDEDPIISRSVEASDLAARFGNHQFNCPSQGLKMRR
jgi:hypothetical protein